MEAVSKIQFFRLIFLYSSLIVCQNNNVFGQNTEKQQLQFTCFIEQSYEALDSVSVKVFKADSLLVVKISDSKGNAKFLLEAGEYSVILTRRGYKVKSFENVKVTRGASFVRALMKRDL